MKVRLLEVARDRMGWGLPELVSALSTEVSYKTIWAWLNGTRFPCGRHLDLLCWTLHCRLDDLLEIERYNFKHKFVYVPPKTYEEKGEIYERFRN